MAKVLTYGELPIEPGVGVGIMCADPAGERCAGEMYSASHGDYFLMPDDVQIECDWCKGPMKLVRATHATVDIEVREAGA